MQTPNPKTLRIAISALLSKTGDWGGVVQSVEGLIHALGKLPMDTEEYVVVGQWPNADWINPLLGVDQRLVLTPRPDIFTLMERRLGPLGRFVGKLAEYFRFVDQVEHTASSRLALARFYDSLDVDLVHFPFQDFCRCRKPTIYNPLDLQHLHYPQFFTNTEFAERELSYKTACGLATAVVTLSKWVKNDVNRQYGISQEKIFAIPVVPPIETQGEFTESVIASIRKQFLLPEIFVLFPAQTWQHKNHLRLLEALSLLRDRYHLVVNLVCTGWQNNFWNIIQKRIAELGLNNQVRFLGYVARSDLQVLYQLAQFIILPSLFEGAGLPILEAFYQHVPLACSNITSMPEYAGDAAFLFDPSSVESIADALRQMTINSGLREELRRRGNERARFFTWEKTAKTYRALYRHIAHVSLSEEDATLLASSLCA